MIDNQDNNIYKMDQKRKINISKIDKILKVGASVLCSFQMNNLNAL